MVAKQKLQQRAQFAKKMIGFLNSKSTQELKEDGIEDITKCVMEINKTTMKNFYRKMVEKKLKEVKESIMRFNVAFDQRTRAGLPSCWD